MARKLSFEADVAFEGDGGGPPACRLCIDLDASRLRSEGDASRSFVGVSSRDISDELEFVRSRIPGPPCTLKTASDQHLGPEHERS